jgi:hypothetical protein
MAAPSIPPQPKGLVPIRGANELFNTTGYPTPNPPGLKMELAITQPKAACFEIYPSQASIEFSIGDLLHFSKVKNIDEIALVVTFFEPAKAELREINLQITSPERKLLHTIRLTHDCGNYDIAPSQSVFFLNEDDAKHADKDFTQGNRLIVNADAAEKISKGEIQVVTRKRY